MNADGQPHQATLLKPGDSINEFTIISVLGDGGFSVVYKAEDTELERLVAIKQFNPSAFSEPTSEARFLREAKLAASLNHPNIVSIYTFRRQHDSLFLIMEYLEGGSVRDLIEQYGHLVLGTLIKLASNVCHALHVLHQRGIIHRDIKPENILCTAEGDFKLADFGLAHITQVDRRRSSIGPQSGTLLYMSPEQAAGQPVTAQSDIYSFATVLYEALTGLYYLPNQTTEEGVLKAIMLEEPRAPSTLNRRIPDTLDMPLLKALAKDPDQRYATADEFLEALRSAVARKKRPSDQLPADLATELYTIRTLRDLLNEPEQAMARLNAPWVRDADFPEVLAERGEMLIRLGDESGYRMLEQAVAAKPALPFAQIALAEHYADEGDADLWHLTMIDAIEADADLVYAMYFDRIVAADHDEFQDYVALFKAAKPSARVYFNLGRVLMLQKSGNGDECDPITAFESAIKFDSAFGPAYVALGSAYLAMGNSVQAIPLFEHAVKLKFVTYPEGEWHKSPSAYRAVHAYLGLGIAYANTGQFEQSIQSVLIVLNQASDILDDHAETLISIYNAAAYEWIENGKAQQASDFLANVATLAMAYGVQSTLMLLGAAQLAVGVDLRKRGNFNDAVAWLTAAHETLKGITLGRGDPLAAQLANQLRDAEHEIKQARHQHR